MKKARDLSPNAKLRPVDYIGYIFGAGTGIPNAILGTFLLVYYSNVLYMSLTTVSAVMAVSKILDGLSDLIMGRIIDKTKSKYGKARPWYVRMILPYAASFLLLFWMPAGIQGTWQLIYIFITYNLVSTVCYTAHAVAHSSMIGFMTLDPKSRGTVGVLSMVANTIVSILVTKFFLMISTALGNGNAYTQKGFTLTIVIYLVIYAACSYLAFLLTRERGGAANQPQSDTAETNTEEKQPTKENSDVPVMEIIKSLVTNRYWILCVVMCLGFYFMFTYAPSATIYFAQYVLGDLSMQGNLTTILYVMILVCVVIALPVMNKIGKKNTMAIGLLVSAIGWLLPAISLTNTMALAGSAVVGLGFGFIAAPAGSFLQDTLTYGTWQSGISAIGMGNAVFSFVNKLSSALGTIILGAVLDAGHFEAKLAVQPDSAITAIRFMYIILPAAICLVCFLISFLYDLDRKLPLINQEVAEGRIGEARNKDLFNK